MNVVSFGTPRSGTTFIESMFVNSSFNCIQGFSNYIPEIFETIDLTKIEKVISTNNNIAIKLGESSCVHPINSQVNFNTFCSIFPTQPIIIRTYRSAINIYKSLLHIGNGINIGHRFKAWDLNSVCAMIISEYAAYIAIKDDYKIININFDKLVNNDYTYTKLRHFPEFCGFILNTYNKTPIRQGILSDKVIIKLDSFEQDILGKIDKIRNIL